MAITKPAGAVHPCEGDADEIGVEDVPCRNALTKKYLFHDPGSWNGAEYAERSYFWLCDDCHSAAVSERY